MITFDILTLSRKERFIAGVSHLFVLIPFLGFLVPSIIWVNNEDRSEYIAFQSLQSLVYQVVVLVIWLIGSVIYNMFWNNAIWFVVLIINWITRFILTVYGITGAIMVFQGASFRYWFIGNKIKDQLSTTSNRQWLANFWRIIKQPIFPVLVGLGISLTHFFITPFLFGPSFGDIKYISGLLLSTPGLMLSFVFDFTTNNILLRCFSSFVYGSIAGIFVSRKIVLQGIAVILISLMFLFGGFLLILAAQAFA